LEWSGRQDGNDPNKYYSHNDFDQNGIDLFSDANEVHQRGTALHNGSHNAYSQGLVQPFIRDLELDFERDALEVRSGLNDYARGLSYDVGSDRYCATTDREPGNKLTIFNRAYRFFGR
jgi:hypothetical protein